VSSSPNWLTTRTQTLRPFSNGIGSLIHRLFHGREVCVERGMTSRIERMIITTNFTNHTNY